MEAGQAGSKKTKDELHMQVLSELKAEYMADHVCSMDRAGKCMNHWINMVPCTANNSVLGKDKFCGMIMHQYQITPKDLPTICN
eukprot:12266482-Ditylum_brightwellii.AAC.1